MNYREAIDWLFSTQMFGIKLGLDGPRRLLKEYLAFPAKGSSTVRSSRDLPWFRGLPSSEELVDLVRR